MELGLVGKVALVTGGSNGLGRAIVARTASGLEAAAEQIGATGVAINFDGGASAVV